MIVGFSFFFSPEDKALYLPQREQLFWSQKFLSEVEISHCPPPSLPPQKIQLTSCLEMDLDDLILTFMPYIRCSEAVFV